MTLYVQLENQNIRITKVLTGVAQLSGRHPTNQKVAGSIPCQGTCLGCGPGPQWRWQGHARGNHTLLFLSLSPTRPLCLKMNKIFFLMGKGPEQTLLQEKKVGLRNVNIEYLLCVRHCMELDGLSHLILSTDF